MQDIAFDLAAQDIVMVNGDFSLTQNPSVQNAGLMLECRGTNLLSPIYGIGIEEVIEADQTTLTYEMNRWKSQIVSDGGRGRWSTVISPGGFNNKWEASYL